MESAAALFDSGAAGSVGFLSMLTERLTALERQADAVNLFLAKAMPRPRGYYVVIEQPPWPLTEAPPSSPEPDPETWRTCPVRSAHLLRVRRAVLEAVEASLTKVSSNDDKFIDSWAKLDFASHMSVSVYLSTSNNLHTANVFIRCCNESLNFHNHNPVVLCSLLSKMGHILHWNTLLSYAEVQAYDYASGAYITHVPIRIHEDVTKMFHEGSDLCRDEEVGFFCVNEEKYDYESAHMEVQSKFAHKWMEASGEYLLDAVPFEGCGDRPLI